MLKHVKNVWIRVLYCGLYGMTAFLAWGQDPVAGPEGETVSTAPGFMDIVYGDALINLVVWILIALTSIATIALIIDAMITLKREKLMPEDLVEGVRESLNAGDLDGAIETCESNPGSLSNILMAAFANITEGYDVIKEAIASAGEIENEKIMQRVNYLNLCGQISPMLGLLGTVLGMVRAFGGLAEATGAARATVLAMSISTALWTTATGLLIAVPALLAYTLAKNYATRVVLEIESTTVDLVKVLRNAEVEEE